MSLFEAIVLGILPGAARGRWPLDLDARLGWFIVIGTIPIGIFGLLFNDSIETKARDLYLIGTALIVFGLVMLVADRVGSQRSRLEDMSPRQGLFVGFAQ